MENRINNAQTIDELNECIKGIEALEWQAEMSDSWKSRNSEISECNRLREMVSERKKILGLA